MGNRPKLYNHLMQTRFFRLKLTLAAVALILAGVLPTEAAKHATPTQNEVFQVAAKAKIVVGTDRHASLADVKAGDHVSITYQQQDGVLVAYHISDDVPHKPRIPGSTPAPAKPIAPHPKKPSPYSHVRGIVESVDAQAGTLTLSYKAKP
jgi:hypothetical protein